MSQALTPVGHEDLQCGVLQEVTSGEYGPDLCEQPFAMKSLGVGQDLQENTAQRRVSQVESADSLSFITQARG